MFWILNVNDKNNDTNINEDKNSEIWMTKTQRGIPNKSSV